MLPTAARIERAIQRAGERHRTRRAVWRQAGGDPERFRELMSVR
jgi:hypothetical protein